MAKVNRRSFLKVTGGLGLSVLGTSLLPLPLWAHDHGGTGTPSPGVGIPPSGGTGSVIDLKLIAREKDVSLFPDRATHVWSYEGEILSAPPSAMTALAGNYLGPILQVRSGDRLRVQFESEVPEETIIHWHGLHIPADMDGHPHAVIQKGQTFQYDFAVENRAGLYFYHPHPHGKLGRQVYLGLAGVLIVRDAEEDALGLPTGEQEHLMVIQDRLFDANRQLEYLTGGMHDRMMGMHGDHILINGQFTQNKTVTRGTQRLRILNASNARLYNLAWSDGRPLTIIGTDGGLLKAPVQRKTLLLGAGERLDVLVDFSDVPTGQTVELQSVPMAAGAGKPFTIQSFVMGAATTAKYQTPAQLCRWDAIPVSESVNRPGDKSFQLRPTAQGWTIDGLTYDPHGVSEKETVQLGTTEIWEFDHTVSGMAHPMHIHGSQFQVLERISGQFQGAFDEGWKDTVLLLPGDRVRVIKRFHQHAGLFVYHCHILEHEDHSMMRNFLVKE